MRAPQWVVMIGGRVVGEMNGQLPAVLGGDPLPEQPPEQSAQDGADQAYEEPPDPLRTYWAAGPDKELAAHIIEKEKNCFEIVRRRGLSFIWRLAHATLFGRDASNPLSFDTQQIGVEGVHGEQLRARFNEPRSMGRQQITIATGQRAAFQASALNTDTAGIAMAPVVDAGVDYFYRRQMPDSKERELVESNIWYGAGYVWWRWDKWAGDEVKIGEQQVPPPSPDLPPPPPIDVYGPSGAPIACMMHPWEEFHEPFQKGEHLWRGVRERRSKFELMALFPDIAHLLEGAKNEHTIVEMEIFGSDWNGNDDDVVVRHWYHRPIGDPNDPKNPLAAGRYFACVGSIPLFPARRLPVSRDTGLPIVEMMAARFHDIAFGYADMWDVLAVQQGEDQVVSDILSNLSTFGRQNMFADEGTEIDFDQVAAGGGVFFVPQTANRAPGFMAPPAMPQAGPWMVDHCGRMKQAITGLNATMRGNPPANISSGEMAALFTNMSVEFQNDTQMTLDEVRRKSANIVKDLIELNAESEMLVQIAGIDARPYLQSFRPEQLKGIKRIDMQTVTPMMRATAGRMKILDVITKLPEELRGPAIILLTTGQWKQVTSTDSAEWIRIKWENEQLAKGIGMPKDAIEQQAQMQAQQQAQMQAQQYAQQMQSYQQMATQAQASGQLPPPMPPSAPSPDPGAIAQQMKSQMIRQKLGVQVVATNDASKDLPKHVEHLNELMQNPDQNADAIDCALTHIMDHLQSAYHTDPLLAQLLKFGFQPPAAQMSSGVLPQQQQDQQSGSASLAQVPAAPDQQAAGTVPSNGSTALPPDRLGPGVPQPAQPPKGAASMLAGGGMQ